MPVYASFWTRIARWTLLGLVSFLLLFAAAWKGWILPSDRQYTTRHADPAAIALPAGYQAEVLATGLNAPTALEIGKDGTVYIGESGYGGAYAATAGVEGQTAGRILRLEPDGRLTVIAGGFNPPLAGFLHDADGNLFVSHAGVVSAITASGRRDILTGLPSWGDHRNNNLALGPDGKLYLAQGTATNSGIVGLDNWALWGRYYPAPHDIPCNNLTLSGVNVTTADPRSAIPFSRVTTGAFVPFGHKTQPGQIVRGQLPCNGAIMKFNKDGSDLQLVAWGLRNPFDLRFGRDGHLYVADDGPDTRGSRPFEAPDLFYRIQPGAWYGWPDYWNGVPVTKLPTSGREKPKMLLARAPAAPQKALTTLDSHAAVTGFDFAPPAFGFDGQAFVALWGSGFPATAQDPGLHGFGVARVDTASGKVETFAANRRPGPASLYKDGGGFERPVAVRFGPDGSMYVLDWGHMSVTRKGPYHVPDGGVLWRIRRVR